MQRYIQYMYSYPHKTAYRPLEGISVKDYLRSLVGTRDNGLYFHIPFCEGKCGYCNLFSVTGQSENRMADYLNAMERQARQYSDLWKSSAEGVPPVFSDFTVGGGTPLLLSPKQLVRMFELAGQYFAFAKDLFTVVETSPNQTTREKLQIVKQFGTSRVSIGVQSFQEEELRTLHRCHTAARAKQALAWIKEAEFPCVNLDLIYGIPGQTPASLEESIKQALEFVPDEIFAYPLYVKEGVWLKNKAAIEEIDEELAGQEYELLRDMLREHGYRQDSMRRFVKKKVKKQDAWKECGFGNTVSIGCGGRSYIKDLHFCTPYAVQQPSCRSILQKYIENPLDWDFFVGYVLSFEEQRRRYVIKHLFFGAGLHKRAYHERFGAKPQEHFPILSDWIQAGYMRDAGGYLGVTEKGMAFSDALGPMLISEEVRGRMKSWREAR
ncbi:MAG: STM4012 family radical SAM protein [bacterium]|nr:STM4012 family radical SAM protein [bacterium]